MSKTDVTISRTLTVSTGNFQSIKPSISFSVKDVDISNVSDVYVTMSEILNGLLKIEIMESNKELDNISKSGGLNSYCKTVTDNIERIGENIEKHLTQLDKYL